MNQSNLKTSRLRKFWVDIKNQLFAKLTKHKVNEEIKAKHLSDLLHQHGACMSALVWQADKGIETAVAECPNPEWLLWFAVKLQVDERLLYKTAGEMLNSVRWMFSEVIAGEIDNVCLKAIDAMISDDEVFERSALSCACSVISRDIDDARWPNRSKYLAVLRATYLITMQLQNVPIAVAIAQSEFALHYRKELVFQESWANSADICREHIGQAIIDKVNGRMANSMQA